MATTDSLTALSKALRERQSVMHKPAEPEVMKEPETPTVIATEDRSSKEGYIHFNDICGYKTKHDVWFKKYPDSHFDPEVLGLIPTSDPTIRIDEDYALAICMGIEHGQSILAYGPPGTGKTVTPQEVCARLNYPYMYIQGMGGTEPSDYIGSPWLESGEMHWKDAVASYAVRHGVFLLFDEPFKTSAQTNMCFQSLLDDRRSLKLYGHPNPIEATLKAHPNFRICLADNVRGVGDSMGKYAAEIQDQSTMDRLDIIVKVDYPTHEHEVAIMKKKFPAMDEMLIKKMIQTAGLIRTAWNKDDVSLPFTMRKTQNWIRNTMETGSVSTGFKLTYLNSCTSDQEIDAVKKAYNTVKFGAGNEL